MADVKTINLTIEGRPVAVAEGTSILEAARTAGVLIPHYCYHPALPVAGVCRMCLVEVEKAPKLAPACATSVAEGQVVHVHSEKAREARKGVLEMLLINHPLDCPICDQAGECELQDYTFQEGRKDSRYKEPKRFNPMEDFGGDVVYVPNRCILCTRCVRYMDDVAQDPVLNVSERGDRAYIGPRCHLGWALIGNDALLAAGVHVPSGANTHGIDDLTTVIRDQPRRKVPVQIGRGSWIGSAAIVMADVGRDSVIAAGAVVTQPIPDMTIAGGVPARVLRHRDARIEARSA